MFPSDGKDNIVGGFIKRFKHIAADGKGRPRQVVAETTEGVFRRVFICNRWGEPERIDEY